MSSWDMFGGAWGGDPSTVPISTMTQQPQPGQPGTVLSGVVDDLFGALTDVIQAATGLVGALRDDAQIVVSAPTTVPTGWPTVTWPGSGWPTVTWPGAAGPAAAVPAAAPAAAPAQSNLLLVALAAIIVVLLLKG